MTSTTNEDTHFFHTTKLIEGNDKILYNEFFTLDGRVGYFYDKIARPNHFNAIDLFHEVVV